MSQEEHFQDLLDQMLAMIEVVPGGNGGTQVQLGDDLAAFIEANPDIMTEGCFTFFQKRREETVDELSQHNLHALGQMLQIVSEHGVSGLERALAGLDPNPIPKDCRAMWEYAQKTREVVKAYSKGIMSSALTVEFASLYFDVASKMGALGDEIKLEVADELLEALIHLVHLEPNEDLCRSLGVLAIYFSEQNRKIEKAILCNQEILKYYTIENHPNQFGFAMNNLGNAYAERTLGEVSANLEQAIEAYKKALLVRKRESDPIDWAMTKNNLGAVYMLRIKGDEAENSRIALKYLTEAQSILSRKDCPSSYKMAQVVA